MIDNVLSFGTLQTLKSDQPLVPASFCQVLLGCQFLSLSPSALCAEGCGTAGAQPVCPLQVGPRERAHISPSSWLIKTFSCSSPLLPPPASYGCSHHADHTNQALIYSIYTILLSPLWLQGIWGMPLPCLPSVQPASPLNVSQSVVVGGVPSHRALLPVGSLPCGGSDHSAVLTTRDLAPQPTVIEVTSQAIPWWIIKRPETELRVT